MSRLTSTSSAWISLLLLLSFSLLQGCATKAPTTPALAAPGNPAVDAAEAAISPLGEEEVLPSDTPEDDFDDFFPEDVEFEDEFAEETGPMVWDPLAPVNRVTFAFNDRLLIYVVKPVALGYKAITPTPLRRGISNFFTNLKMPIRFLSSLLQGKVKGAGRELGRFAVNTTVGVLGFGDPATEWLHIKPSNEDLGQTLGHWGVGNGFYIVWPIIGPSTARDSASLAEVAVPNPVTYDQPLAVKTGVTAFEKINDASFTIEDYETLIQSALDPYTFVRDLYIRSRNQALEE